MDDVNLNQKVQISQPKPTKGYGIQVVEWEFIKNKVSQIKDEPNLYFIFSSVFLGACISTFIYSLTGNFPKTTSGSISTPHAISWLFVFFTGILALIFFIFGKKFSEIKQIRASYILEQMDIIEARYKSSETEISQPIKKIIFIDKFEKFEGWENYLEGRVSLTKEISPYIGQYCLKKEKNDDPHGGYKKIGKSISLGFYFVGWLYRPSEKRGGKAERIAIEDPDFNGYGFSINHRHKFIVIERREKGHATQIGKRINFNPIKNEWYQFEFYSSVDGKFAVYLNNSRGERLINNTAIDSKFSHFDRITIHGGHPYYIDNLELIER